jgi:hypothetical protein
LVKSNIYVSSLCIFGGGKGMILTLMLVSVTITALVGLIAWYGANDGSVKSK